MKTLLLAGAVLAAATATRAQAAEDWNVKLQSTYTWQAKPGFASPYEGEHSLVGAREKSYSFTATAALGFRLGTNTEAYFDPEVSQGVPLSGLFGLAGFTNGEMARTAGPNPTLYRARLFVRHVIALGDESEDIEPAMNQLGSTYAKRRLTLTAGNVSVLDLFDANQYNHDPRTQFLNWTVMTHGAYDFAADARGYTWGVAAEYQGDDWALRVGRFIQPREPNQLKLDSRILRHYGDQIEVEKRYELSPERPGAVRLLAYRNRALMSRYDEALALADANGNGTVPSLDAVRTTEHSKVGIGVNLEQAVTRSLGIFARAMWADGQTETYAFTEADRSLSAGLSAQGSSWGRGKDRLGLALATNFLSTPHRQVLARGGLTFFLGDGRLNYKSEQIVEAYYAWAVSRGVTLSFDVQRLQNPGYNADRGPASFYALRLHVEN